MSNLIERLSKFSVPDHLNIWPHEKYAGNGDIYCSNMPDGFIRYHVWDEDLDEEEAGEMLPWVSVKDRLPEDWDIVPAWHGGGMWMSAYRYKGNWYSCVPGTVAMRIGTFITHWIEVTPPEEN